ncbi:transcription factor bHLH25-like [Euphorbia lathyris]|uniref:transcription factor bHLH25-like n=1 Tax=Euphorbia lathyris TaxID=212925 RepID=UPI0033141C31
MDIGSSTWFPEQELEDYSLIHEFNMKSLADLTVETSLEKKLDQSLSYPSFSLHKLSFNSQILSFDAKPRMSEPKDHEVASPTGSMHFQRLMNSKPSEGSIRNPSHAQNHTLAERKRRQKLSHQFIALSAILPTLNKKDKASVLGDAIKYVKQLEERVQVLEKQTKKRSVESVALVKKSHLSIDDDFSSSDEKSIEIEARVSEKDILVRIHCDKQQGVIPKILNQIENLNLSIINTSVLPFGNSTLHITIIAQMDAEFSMAVNDLVKNLRLAFLKFM